MTCGRERRSKRGRTWWGGRRLEQRTNERWVFLSVAARSAVGLTRVILCSQLFIVRFQIPCYLVFAMTKKEWGSGRPPDFNFVRLCNLCSSAAFIVTHLSLPSLSLRCESELDLSPAALFFIFLLFLWQAWELSRPWHQPGEHHGDHCPLQPANWNKHLRHGQHARSSLQYATFRYMG